MKNKSIIGIFILVLISLAVSSWAQTNNHDLAVIDNSNPNVLNLTSELIQQRIEMFLIKNYHDNHNEIVVECDNLPTPIPVDRVDWEVKVEMSSGAVKNGANLLEVTVFARKEVYKKFTTTARLRTFDEIVVANKMLQRQQTVVESDVKVVRIETTNFKRDYFTLIDDVLNLQTKQVVAANNPIFTNMLELPDIIRQGDLIKIVVKLKNVEATATGKALESGHRGEKIKVQNLTTSKKMSAEVVDEKTVLVEL